MGVKEVSSSPGAVHKIYADQDTLDLSSALKEFVALKSYGEDSFQGIKAILERLYLWFIHNSRVARHVNFDDVVCISKTLFEELSKRLYVPLDNTSTNQSLGEEKLQSESDAVEEEIIMLLRCCIASVNFLEYDQCQLVGRCDFLHRILCMLCSCQKNDISEGCQNFSPMNPDIHSQLVCRILEVFMSELITNKSLSRYIKSSASFSPARENLCHCIDSGYVMKVASAHFIQSCSGVQALEGSVENLIWMRKENRAAPEVSLTAAISLLINPALASPPAFFQAHLISLISDVIGRVLVYDHMDPSLRFISCHMPAFERSVSLYHRQLPKLLRNHFSENDDSFIKSAIPRAGRQRPFESYVCPTMNKRLDIMINKIDCSSCIMSSQTNSNMVETLNSYVKENLHLLDESCQSIASLFLSSLVEKAISAESDDASLHMNGKLSSQDIYLLASILKLMSCSLLQTVLYVSSVGPHSVHMASSGNPFPSEEYQMLVCIIDSFGQYGIQLPVQKLLHDKLESHFSTVNGSKLMFVHFTGLLSICLAGGVEILAKGCLYMMLNLMNLLFFEDGCLNFLSQSITSEMECDLPQHPPAKVSVENTPLGLDSFVGMQEGHTNKKSSVKLASKFKKIQMSCMWKESASGSQDEEAGDMRVEDKTCNGAVYLKYANKKYGSYALDEEILDFIECKQGKDYSAWLKNRTRYRTWKSQKLEAQAWEMKKATWRSTRRTRERSTRR